jgi:hypothetical protein
MEPILAKCPHSGARHVPQLCSKSTCALFAEISHASLADCITVMSEFEFSVHTRLNITLFLLLARQRAFNPLLPTPRLGPFIADIRINN